MILGCSGKDIGVIHQCSEFLIYYRMKEQGTDGCLMFGLADSSH